MRRTMITIALVTLFITAMQLFCQTPSMAYGAGITLYGYAYQNAPWPAVKPGAQYVCVSGSAGRWTANCNWLGRWELNNIPSNGSYWVTAYSRYLGLQMRTVSIQVSIPDRKWYLPWTSKYQVRDLLVPYR